MMSSIVEDDNNDEHRDRPSSNQKQEQHVLRNTSGNMDENTSTTQPSQQQQQQSQALVEQTKLSSWYFWNSRRTVLIETINGQQQTIDQEGQVEGAVQPQIEILDTQPYNKSEPQPPTPSWWQSFFTSASNPVNNPQIEESSDTTPLLHNKKETHHEPQNSWWTWITGGRSTEDNEDEEYSSDISNLELYKSAKSTIEFSKSESHHYIFRNTIHCKNIELAVFNSLTEENPVIYSSRKRPLLATEILENSISNGNNRPDSVSSIGSFDKDSGGNIVNPLIEDNYREITLKTKLRIYSGDILCGLEKEAHLYRKKNIFKTARIAVKRITIIGVHSFLPNKMVRALIGKNTGNANKFVNKASKAIVNWLKANNPEFDINDYVIETLAIEGEGKINDRIEKSIKLLKNNWMDVLESSDFIFMTSYGTSCNLAVNLMAQMLIEFTGLQNVKYLGLLCLNGNLNGPVIGIDSKLVVRAFTSNENDIIKELFEFNHSNSKLSNQMTESMKILIENNVKITFTGDINDLNFIPLSSSLGLQYNHPNIRRNIYCEEEKSSVPFIFKLLSILCLIRNLGMYNNDYNLIKDLGDKLYPSQYGTTSTPIYLEEKVYEEAIKFSLETTNLINKSEHELLINYSSKFNPEDNFYNLLPWNLRSLFHDLMNVKHINNLKLIFDLIQEFNNWTPLTNGNKNFKDIKYCLSFLEDFEITELLMS